MSQQSSEPTPPSNATSGSARDGAAGLEERAKRAVAMQEFAFDLGRVRSVARVGIPIWFAFLLVDWLQATYVGTGHLRELVTARVASGLVLTGLGVLAHVASWITPAILEACFALAGATLTVGVSFMCLYSGGFESYYAGGILLSTIVMVLLPRPFSRAMPIVALVLLPYPAVLFGSTLFMPEMRAQIGTVKAITLAGLFHVVGIAACIFIAFVSHTLWSIRHELFESRSMGRYRLERRLGKGGMGEVWSAWHNGLKRRVAVKFLRPQSEFDGQSAKRFEREIHAMATLSHPNTVRLYDFGVSEDGSLYYAMELLEGETFRNLVRRVGALPPERVVHLLVQAARALGEAHARGIVHRDVKAENLFVTTIGSQGDVVKVLDFGIASVLDEPGLAVTRTGAMLGTVTTISPEVAVGGAATPASDVYALGVVAYLLLTGELPFGEDKSGATLIAHIQEPPPRPGKRSRYPLPPDLEALVLRCLAKAPTDRYVDGNVLAQALEECSVSGRWRPSSERPPAPRLVVVDSAELDLGASASDVEATRPLPRRDPDPS